LGKRAIWPFGLESVETGNRPLTRGIRKPVGSSLSFG
jgi:hypothetical protein